MKSKTEIGKIGEQLACEYLVKKGYTVLQRNYRIGHLEADIICENETHLLFVEVKSRTDFGGTPKYGRPAAAVDTKKQANLLLLAREYLYRNPTKKRPRIDVIEVYLQKYGDHYLLSEKGMKHIENAVMGS